jgi:hypothetical protein
MAIWPANAISQAGLQALTSTPGVLAADSIQASVDLNFAGNSGFNQGATGTAASMLTFNTGRTSGANAASVQDTAGNVTFVPDTALRISNQGLLVEEARTNLVLYSSDTTQAYWTSALTNVNWVQGKSSPDGGTNASLLQDINTTPNVAHAAATTAAAVFTAGATLTYSAFFRPAPYTTVCIVVRDAPSFTNGFVAAFTMTGTGSFSNGATSGTGTFVSAAITAYANGWYRISMTGTIDTNGTPSATTARFSIDPNTLNCGIYTGVVGNGILHWNSQLEVGAFATSPIRTTGAAVTRTIDLPTLTIPPTFGSAITGYVAGTPAAAVAYPIAQNMLQIDNNSDAQRMVWRRNSATGNALFAGVGVTWNVTPGVPFMATGALSKFAGSATAGTQLGVLNAGSAGQTAAAGLPSPLNTVHIGFDGSNAEPFDGYISRMAVWSNNAISTTGLQGLTQ